jgi:hypothetical protein
VLKGLLLLLQRVLNGVLLRGVVDVRHREREVHLGQYTVKMTPKVSFARSMGQGRETRLPVVGLANPFTDRQSVVVLRNGVGRVAVEPVEIAKAHVDLTCWEYGVNSGQS